MVGPRARRSSRRNPPPTGEDEVAGAAATEGSSTPTQAPAVARAPTPYSAIERAGTGVCGSPRRNPSLVKRVINEPPEQALGALIDNSGFCALTLNPPPLFTPVESYLQSC